MAALAILIPLAVPLLSLNLGQKDVAALSTSTTERRAYDLISQNFGPGVNGPLIVAVSLGSPAQASVSSRPGGSGRPVGETSPSPSPVTSDPRATDPGWRRCSERRLGHPGVAAVTPIQIDRPGRPPTSTRSPPPARPTGRPRPGHTLRSSVIPAAEKGTNMTAYVGGTTAGYADLAADIAASSCCRSWS